MAVSPLVDLKTRYSAQELAEQERLRRLHFPRGWDTMGPKECGDRVLP